MTNTDRTMMTDSDGFLLVASLRTFVAEHNLIPLILPFCGLASADLSGEMWEHSLELQLMVTIRPATGHISGSLCATHLDTGEHAAIPFPINPKRDIYQRNKYRNLDQRTDDCCERGAVVDAESCDCNRDRQFEVIG